MSRDEPIDLHDLVEAICDRLGAKAKYVYRLDIEPDRATVYLYKGADGFCEGSKFVIRDEASPYCGEAALEPPLTRKVTS